MSAHSFPLLDNWIGRATVLNRRILLPEGEDPRILRAARAAVDLKLCSITLIGNRDRIATAATQIGIDLAGLNIISIDDRSLLQDLADYYSQMRQKESGKPLPHQIALGLISNPLNFSCLLLARRMYDGVVAGAVNTTAAVLRAGRLILGTSPGVNSISSCFCIDCPTRHIGDNGILGFADCAVITEPTAEQLAEIAVETAKTMRLLVTDFTPHIAFVSFSTHGSSRHPTLEKLTTAVRLVRERHSDLIVDGELQVDAALDPAIAASKAGDSPIKGNANILIFPDLNSANIGYKLVQYSSNARCYGPIFQGIKYPLNDLSRGATPEDILNVIAITCLQCTQKS